MTTKARKTKIDLADLVTGDDIADRLDRAEALAYVLADAAAAGIGVDEEHVNHIGQVIAREVAEAKTLLADYLKQQKEAA